MSKVASKDAESYASALASAEDERRGRLAIIAELESLKAKLMGRGAVSPPPAESPLEQLERKQSEYIARFEGERAAAQKAALEAERHATEVERLNCLQRPQDPPRELLEAVLSAVGRFLAADNYRCGLCVEQERQAWMYFDALLTALEDASRPGRSWPGWPTGVPKAVKLIREALDDVAMAWGWRPYLGPDRAGKVAEAFVIWERDTAGPLGRISELWLTSAEAGRAGFAWPNAEVEARAKEARAKGLRRLGVEITSTGECFADPIHSFGYRAYTAEAVESAHVAALDRRASLPALGACAPHLRPEFREALRLAKDALVAAMPKDEPQRGLILGGTQGVPS